MTDRNLTDADVQALAKAIMAEQAPASAPVPDVVAPPVTPEAVVATPTVPATEVAAPAESSVPAPAVDPLEDFAQRFRLAVTEDVTANLRSWLQEHFGVTL